MIYRLKSRFQWFKSGRTSVENDPRDGSPATIRTLEEPKSSFDGVRDVRKLVIQKIVLSEMLYFENEHPHHNASVNSSQLIQKFVVKHGIVQLRQLGCNLDLSSRNFWVYPKLGNLLKWTTFDDVDEMKRNAMKMLLGVPEAEYRKCFWMWNHPKKILIFKGDTITID